MRGPQRRGPSTPSPMCVAACRPPSAAAPRGTSTPTLTPHQEVSGCTFSQAFPPPFVSAAPTCAQDRGTRAPTQASLQAKCSWPFRAIVVTVLCMRASATQQQRGKSLRLCKTRRVCSLCCHLRRTLLTTQQQSVRLHRLCVNTISDQVLWCSWHRALHGCMCTGYVKLEQAVMHGLLSKTSFLVEGHNPQMKLCPLPLRASTPNAQRLAALPHLLLRTPSAPQQSARALTVHLAPLQAARLRRRSTQAPFAQLAAALAPPPCLHKGLGTLPEAAAARRRGVVRGRLPHVHHLSTGAPHARLAQHASGLPAAPACVGSFVQEHQLLRPRF